MANGNIRKNTVTVFNETWEIIKKYEMDKADVSFKAALFAFIAHWGQYRPGTKILYIVHLLRGQVTNSHYDLSKDIEIACLLHDTLDDTKDVKVEDIASLFDKKVASLVYSASYRNKDFSWQKRREEKIEFIWRSISFNKLLVLIIDKLDNIQSIGLNSERVGKKFWKTRFKTHTRKEISWYYKSLSKAFKKRIKDLKNDKRVNKKNYMKACSLINEFSSNVNWTFGQRALLGRFIRYILLIIKY